MSITSRVHDAPKRRRAVRRTAEVPRKLSLRTGLKLVENFLTTIQTRDGGGAPGDNGAAAKMFETIRDERTGGRYLKIRMPEPEVVDRVVQSFQTMLEHFRR